MKIRRWEDNPDNEVEKVRRYEDEKIMKIAR